MNHMLNFYLVKVRHILLFETSEELEEMRKKQEAAKVRTGYYGVWAKSRNLSVEEAISKIKKWRRLHYSFKISRK